MHCPEPAPRGFSRGVRFEKKAERWLKSRGLTTVARNFRTRRGEIDLIMLDAETLVFIEVRHRSTLTHGTALESISDTKVTRLRDTAAVFLQRNSNQWSSPPACRFDVVAFDGSDSTQSLRWERNAF